jgi:methionyl-tRNA formyltransferase
MTASIIFMGTPEFAVPSLSALIRAGYEIPLVVTQPDRPSGRGHKLTPPPIKTLALQNNLEVFQPDSLRKSPEAVAKIRAVPCDFLVVVAFGQILPQEILDHPRQAPLNVHASLLPMYRGAAPIARSVLEEESETGISIQWMVKELDMGDVLFQLPCLIENNDTSESLHDRLKVLGANALLSTLEQFSKQSFRRSPQNPRIGSYAPKLSREEALIDFHQNAHRVHRQIMGLNPWPGAECRFRGERLKVWRSRFVARAPRGESGSIMETGPDGILVACQEACIEILELQLDNRNRMSAKDFLNSNTLPEGLILGGAHT